MARYPECQPIATRLRNLGGGSVEALLTHLESEAPEYPERLTQLAAIRYYLRDLLWECQTTWAKLTQGVTNYKALLDHIERWRHRYHTVTLATFNYDTLLEEALPALARPIEGIDDYIGRDPAYATIKLHGSVNWARHIGEPLNAEARGSDLAAYAWIVKNISNVTVSPTVHVYPRTYVRMPDQPQYGLVPAIAVPLRRKADFECPAPHVRALEMRLKDVSKILVIGWRAQDPALLELVASIRKPGVKGLIVAEKEQEAKAIRQTLMQHNVAGSFGLAAGGFSDLVKGPD